MKQTKTDHTYSARKDRNLRDWVAFWRQNPHLFAQEYLGLHLFLYQKILLYMMDKVSLFMYIAARGQGKSFIIAVYCVIRCILYPGTSIVIASGKHCEKQYVPFPLEIMVIINPEKTGSLNLI